MRRALLALLMLPALLANAPAAPDVFASPPLPDTELADLRGGFRLPGGLEVAVAITTATMLNGQLAVRSVLRIDDGAPQLQVFGRDGARITLEGGSAVTQDGTIRLQTDGADRRIVFNGDRISVEHLAGRALGSIVSNRADDRQIDVLTTVDVTIGNARPDLVGSALIRAESLIESNIIRR